MSSSLSVQTIDVRERILDDVIKELTRRIADKFTPKLNVTVSPNYGYATLVSLLTKKKPGQRMHHQPQFVTILEVIWT